MFNKKAIILNSDPTDECIGWQCIESGTPGTENPGKWDVLGSLPGVSCDEVETSGKNGVIPDPETPTPSPD